ncbi:MAG: protein adenylyltransferase SelO family protein, partial [Bradyrhizobium sp.]
LWNLTRLAECLVPLFSDDQDKAIADAQDVLGGFAEKFNLAYVAGLRKKLGLFTAREDDHLLAQALLDAMANGKADFTLAFRRLSDAAGDGASERKVRDLFAEPQAFDEWIMRWRQRIEDEPQPAQERQAAMRAVNPAFIPRNHRVEAVIRAAEDRDDYAPFEELLDVLSRPFDDRPAYADYERPPQPHERVCQTFCGT